MKPSPALAFVVVCLLLTPRAAMAGENEERSAVVMLVRPDVVAPIGPKLPLFAVAPAPAPFALLARTPEDVRLSRGAKTAIIITAIVVGVLLVVGVVAVTRPGHL